MFGCISSKDIRNITSVRIDLDQSLLGLYIIDLMCGDDRVYEYQCFDKATFTEILNQIGTKIINEEPIEV